MYPGIVQPLRTRFLENVNIYVDPYATVMQLVVVDSDRDKFIALFIFSSTTAEEYV